MNIWNIEKGLIDGTVGFKVASCQSEMCQSQPVPAHRLHFIKFQVSMSQYNLNKKKLKTAIKLCIIAA